MIDHVLTLIVNRLNQHLKEVVDTREDIAVLMDLANLSGPASRAQNKIIVSVTNITEDVVSKGVSHAVNASAFTHQEPLNLNIQFVVAANFEPTNYSEGLKALSRAIQFFHAFAVYNRRDSPELVKRGIELLTIEMENLEGDSVSRLWGVLGGRYLPSAVYKARFVNSGAQSLQSVAPLVGSGQVEPMHQKS